jgi:hypothetical protein
MKRRIPRPGTVLGAIALTIAGVGVAQATIPSGDGTYYGCYDANGTLRLFDHDAAGTGCFQSETPVSFKDTPPTGGAGARGVDGTNGRAGANCITGTTVEQSCRGASGSTTIPALPAAFTRSATAGTLELGSVGKRDAKTISAACPSGQIRLGAFYGFRKVDSGGAYLALNITLNGPTQSGQGWRMRFTNDSGENVQGYLGVVCGAKP